MAAASAAAAPLPLYPPSSPASHAAPSGGRPYHAAALRRHVGDWLAAYNFARQLKALRWLTPLQAIAAAHARKPDLLVRPPGHLAPGPNSGQPRGMVCGLDDR